MPAHPSVVTSRIRMRRGRCYELSVIAMLRMQSAEWSLVQGVIRAPLALAHAWLERGSEIWDPVENVGYPKIEYGRRFRAQELGRWHLAQMAEMVDAYGTYGPWTDLPKGTMLRAKGGGVLTTRL